MNVLYDCNIHENFKGTSNGHWNGQFQGMSMQYCSFLKAYTTEYSLSFVLFSDTWS